MNGEADGHYLFCFPVQVHLLAQTTLSMINMQGTLYGKKNQLNRTRLEVKVHNTNVIKIKKKIYTFKIQVSLCYGGQTDSYSLRINIQSFLRVLTFKIHVSSLIKKVNGFKMMFMTFTLQ